MKKYLLLFAFLAFSPAWAVTVKLEGLFGQKVVLTVNDGRPQTVMVGGTTAEGIKVLEIKDRSVLLIVEGQDRWLSLGEGAYAAGGAGGDGSDNGTTLTLPADSQGHFTTLGSINGATIRFVVDTGATLVTISTADARRAGIDVSNAKPAQAQTASGIVPFYPVILNSLKVGDIELLNVPAGVLETNNPIALLGGSFLNRMEMKRDGNILTLKKRY